MIQEYEEVVEGAKVNLKCPTNDPTLCLWHHEDRRIPEHYGKWTMSTTGSLQLNGAEVEHSGTYYVIVSGRKYIYHLGEWNYFITFAVTVMSMYSSMNHNP